MKTFFTKSCPIKLKTERILYVWLFNIWAGMGQISCSILSKDTLIFNQQTTHLLLFHRSMCVPSTKVPQPSSIFIHFLKSPSKIVNCLILITRIKETLSPSAVHPVCLSALRQWMIVCQRVSVSYRSLRTLCNWAIVTPPVLSVCVCVFPKHTVPALPGSSYQPVYLAHPLLTPHLSLRCVLWLNLPFL